MASKYIKLFKIPVGFEDIINDFAREVLRNQPEDIIDFGVEYFKFKEENQAKEKEDIAKEGYKVIPFDYSKKGQNIPANFVPHRPIAPVITEVDNKLRFSMEDKDRLKASLDEIEKLKKYDVPLRQTEFGVLEGFGDIVDNPKVPVFEDDGYIRPDPRRDLEREEREEKEKKEREREERKRVRELEEKEEREKKEMEQRQQSSQIIEENKENNEPDLNKIVEKSEENLVSINPQTNNNKDDIVVEDANKLVAEENKNNVVVEDANKPVAEENKNNVVVEDANKPVAEENKVNVVVESKEEIKVEVVTQEIKVVEEHKENTGDVNQEANIVPEEKPVVQEGKVEENKE